MPGLNAKLYVKLGFDGEEPVFLRFVFKKKKLLIFFEVEPINSVVIVSGR